METANAPTRRSAFFAAALAIVFTVAYHALFGDHDINLRDEGYLWYGLKRVLAGEVPLRDFQAYDPGRYYWCAALSHLFGNGVLGLRASVAVFECIGLTAGLLVLRRLLRNDAWLIPAGLVLMLWMFPRHKLFEHSITLMAMLMATRLLERPTARRHLAAGVFVGLAAFFGRNHGLYLTVAFALVVLLSRWRQAAPSPLRLPRAAASGALGIALGYTPLLAMLAFVPGFASSFHDAVFSVVANGANVPKPFPWPWEASFAGLHGFELASAVALTIAFALPAVLIPAGILYALRQRCPAPLAAALAVAIPYTHHYAVCSDLPHLGQAFMPILVLGFAFAALAKRGPWLALTIAVLLPLSGLVALEGNAQLRPLAPGAPKLERTTLIVDGDELNLKVVHATTLDRLQRLIARHLQPEDDLLIVPMVPTLYPVFAKRSPIWWIYFFWPATEEQQQDLMRRLEEQNVRWALISSKPFNGQVEYNFDQTHPLVWQHFQRQWTAVDDPLVPANYTLIRRR